MLAVHFFKTTFGFSLRLKIKAYCICFDSACSVQCLGWYFRRFLRMSFIQAWRVYNRRVFGTGK